MGFYVETAENLNKADQLVASGKFERIEAPTIFDDIPEGKTVVCVVQNGPFDAAGICYDEAELEEFLDPGDTRPKTWLIADTATVAEMCPPFKDFLANPV